MSSKRIDIDIETNKLIESFREDFNESENDIIKKILKEYISSLTRTDHFTLDTTKSFGILNDSKGLFWKGVLLPNGLKLRKISKGVTYTAIVQNGRIICNNREYFSPSAAATNVFGTTVNGWMFWEYFNEEQNEWCILDILRKK